MNAPDSSINGSRRVSIESFSVARWFYVLLSVGGFGLRAPSPSLRVLAGAKEIAFRGLCARGARERFGDREKKGTPTQRKTYLREPPLAKSNRTSPFMMRIPAVLRDLETLIKSHRCLRCVHLRWLDTGGGRNQPGVGGGATSGFCLPPGTGDGLCRSGPRSVGMSVSIRLAPRRSKAR